MFLRSITLFSLAGLAEIAGGYFIWIWLREGAGVTWGLAGGIILIVYRGNLVLYGVIPTLQEYPHFGRVYAAYGGVFIVLSLLWGWFIDKKRPDKYDWVGSCVALAGAAIIIWTPR